jgi:uncharacterized protein YdeI (BOF family)
LEEDVEQSASLKILDEQTMAHDSFYAIHELLISFAYSETQFLNAIESKINEDIAKKFSADQNISPANMIYFQGRLDNHAEMLERNVATITIAMS